MRRLKTTEVKAIREELLVKQGGRCAICQMPVKEGAALDHDHSTGLIRGVLHRACNTSLGKVENHWRRYGHPPNPSAFLQGAGTYMQQHQTDQHGLLHPSYRSDDEKRLARNAKARARRAKA